MKPRKLDLNNYDYSTCQDDKPQKLFIEHCVNLLFGVQATQLQDSTSFSGFRSQQGVLGGGPGSDRLSTMRQAFAVSF